MEGEEAFQNRVDNSTKDFKKLLDRIELILHKEMDCIKIEETFSRGDLEKIHLALSSKIHDRKVMKIIHNAAKRLEGKTMETKVVHCKKEKFDIYIGRPSAWGNPFSVSKYGRVECLKQYKEWIVKQPELMAMLHQLKGKILGCWCKPLACHGDILVELVDEEAKKWKEKTQELLKT